MDAETPALAHALRFAKDFGAYVFPCAPKTKRPVHGYPWQDSSTNDLDQIRELAQKYTGCNFAVDLERSGLAVLDVDNKAGSTLGWASLENMIAVLNEGHSLWGTLAVDTPSNGLHLYYKGLCASKPKLVLGEVEFPKIETKSAGGYVMLPGSVYYEEKEGWTREYKIRQDLDPDIGPVDIAPLPDEILEMAGAPVLKAERQDRKASRGGVVEDDGVDMEGSVASALEYLKIQPKVGPGERNPTTFARACKLRDFGLSMGSTAALMSMHGEEKYEPPLEDWELRSAVAHAYQYAQNAKGVDAVPVFPADDSDKALRAWSEAQITEADRVECWNLSDLIGKPAPPREWIIEDWLLSREISSLYADGGTGKSLLALQLAVSIATKRPWLGKEILIQPKILVVSCEDTTEELHRRFQDIMSHTDYIASEFFSPDAVRCISMVGRVPVLADVSKTEPDFTAFYHRVEKELRAMGDGPKMVILDTLADIYLGSEIDRGQTNRFVKSVLGRLKEEVGATVFFLAHPSRTGKNTGDQLSGSTAWHNAVRGRWIMHPHEKVPSVVVLNNKKNNYGQTGQELYLRYDFGVYVDAGDPEALLAEAVGEDAVALVEDLEAKHDRGIRVWNGTGGVRMGSAVDGQQLGADAGQEYVLWPNAAKNRVKDAIKAALGSDLLVEIKRDKDRHPKDTAKAERRYYVPASRMK